MKNPKKPKPFTPKQIEILADGMLEGCDYEDIVTTPLILLLDEIARNSFNQSFVESLANTVMRRCYAGTADADDQEKAFIKRARAQWAKALESVA